MWADVFAEQWTVNTVYVLYAIGTELLCTQLQPLNKPNAITNYG